MVEVALSARRVADATRSKGTLAWCSARAPGHCLLQDPRAEALLSSPSYRAGSAAGGGKGPRPAGRRDRNPGHLPSEGSRVDRSVQLCALRLRIGTEAGAEGGGARARGYFLGAPRGTPLSRELGCCSSQSTEVTQDATVPRDTAAMRRGAGGWTETASVLNLGNWKPLCQPHPWGHMRQFSRSCGLTVFPHTRTVRWLCLCWWFSLVFPQK